MTPSVKLPAELAAKPGRITQLKAETSGKLVRWACYSDAADLIPDQCGGKTALFSSPTPGRYRVLAWTAAGDVPSDAAVCVVVVGDAPPGPAPGPSPAPGTLAGELAELLRVDPSPAKKADAAALAELYGLMVPECTARDAGTYRHATAAGLNARFIAARDSMLKPGAIQAVRDRCGREVAAAAPADPDAPLTDGGREKLAYTFTRLAAALREVAR